MTILAVSSITLNIACLWHNGARIDITASGGPVEVNKDLAGTM